MRPSPEVNELILGVLGRAQAKYSIELYAFVFLSNHFHILMRADSPHQMARFIGFLKANIAKELGRLHGWREKFWGRRYHSASLADSESTQIARFRYLLANGCKEGLVDSPLSWPGVSSAPSLYSGRETLRGVWFDRTAEHRSRPSSAGKRFPCDETVRLTPLPFLADRRLDERRAFVVDAIRQIEGETRARHRRECTKPRGARFVTKRAPHSQPSAFHPSSAPLFHAKTRRELRQMRFARALKVALYRDAAIRLRGGARGVQFPEGCFPPPGPFVVSRGPP